MEEGHDPANSTSEGGDTHYRPMLHWVFRSRAIGAGRPTVVHREKRGVNTTVGLAGRWHRPTGRQWRKRIAKATEAFCRGVVAFAHCFPRAVIHGGSAFAKGWMQRSQ